MAFLCHIFFSEGVEVDPRKTEAVKNFPRPLTPTNIRSFLGLAGYYWRFVDGFVFIESPLTTFTQKSTKFEWSETCERIFQILKNRLACAQVLTLSRVQGFSCKFLCIPTRFRVCAYATWESNTLCL